MQDCCCRKHNLAYPFVIFFPTSSSLVNNADLLKGDSCRSGLALLTGIQTMTFLFAELKPIYLPAEFHLKASCFCSSLGLHSSQGLPAESFSLSGGGAPAVGSSSSRPRCTVLARPRRHGQFSGLPEGPRSYSAPAASPSRPAGHLAAQPRSAPGLTCSQRAEATHRVALTEVQPGQLRQVLEPRYRRPPPAAAPVLVVEPQHVLRDLVPRLQPVLLLPQAVVTCRGSCPAVPYSSRGWATLQPDPASLQHVSRRQTQAAPAQAQAQHPAGRCRHPTSPTRLHGLRSPSRLVCPGRQADRRNRDPQRSLLRQDANPGGHECRWGRVKNRRRGFLF